LELAGPFFQRVDKKVDNVRLSNTEKVAGGRGPGLAEEPTGKETVRVQSGKPPPS